MTRRTGFQGSSGLIRTIQSSAGVSPAYVVDQEIRAGRLYCKWFDPSNGAQDWACVVAQSAEPGALRVMRDIEPEVVNMKFIENGQFDRLTTCVLSFRPGDDVAYIMGFIPPPSRARGGRATSGSSPSQSGGGSMATPVGSGAYHDPFQPLGSADWHKRTLNAGLSAGSVVLLQDNGSASVSASDNLHLQVLKLAKSSAVPGPADTFSTHMFLNCGQDPAGSEYLLYGNMTVEYLNQLVQRIRMMHQSLIAMVGVQAAAAKVADDSAAAAAGLPPGAITAAQAAIPNYEGQNPKGFAVSPTSPAGQQVPEPNATFNTPGCLKVPFIRVTHVQ